MKSFHWFWLSVGGAAAVALGAFGAHTLKPYLVASDTENVWQTAVFYHFIHVVAGMATIAAARANALSPRLSGRAVVAWWTGILLFSGSLYILALGGPRPLAWVTPIGGVAFLIGWVMLGIAGWKGRNSGS